LICASPELDGCPKGSHRPARQAPGASRTAYRLFAR
jgi:hypothetical protein